ncbi:MAG: Crp/Fnr family transcriptional regulator [Alphaproteobacteria bacterium]|nr:Crp/Fnr family transcriptional regulator [Alphaproteobacteria bacterium]
MVAVENCLLASIAPQTFKTIMHDHPDIANEVLQRLARIIRICDDRILDLSTLRAVQRVYVELLRLAQPSPLNPGSFLIRPMPTHKDVASWAGTTRETVARVMSHLAEAGVVERKDRALYIRDKARIEHLAETLDPDHESEHTR